MNGRADEETFCSLCGHLILMREVAARMDGSFIDFENRGDGEITMEFCSECWSKILTVTDGGISRARKLWRELHSPGDE